MQEELNYKRIAEAIDYIKVNFKQQPDLDTLAREMNLSTFHFQKLFTEWAGVSPKKFIQYLSVEYAKGLLREKQVNLFDAAYETGLSGTGRLHDLFVSIEAMTPGEYKNEGENIQINYQFYSSPFGEILLASTSKGLCFAAFYDDEKLALEELKNAFPKANYSNQEDVTHQNTLKIFLNEEKDLAQVKLHLKATSFQLKVWQALLKIPFGDLTSYGKIATQINSEGASRAVGKAVGDNPIAFLIPCHRVIRAEGTYGQYRWGATRKSAIIGWEASQMRK